jgi:hypothetical protein
MGHYLELYSKETAVHQSAFDEIDQLPYVTELDLELSVEELSKAIDILSSGKAPGVDGIPAEIIRSGKAGLLKPLQKLLTKCREEGAVSQDTRNANIVTLQKQRRPERLQ